MKKLFGHTVKPKHGEYDDNLQGRDGMEEAIEENAEYGEERVYVEEEYYAAEGEEYYVEENPGEEYTETGYIEPEFGEAGEFEEPEEFEEAGEFEEPEEFVGSEDLSVSSEFEESGESVEFEELGAYYSQDGGEYYIEETPGQEYTDSEYREPGNVEGGEYAEVGEYGEIEEYAESGEYEETEEYAGTGDYAETGEYEEIEEYAESGEYEETEEHVGTGDYAETDEYEENGEYAESGKYEETEEYTETGKYEETEEYTETGEYEGTEEYAESGKYEETEEYAEAGEYEGTGKYARTSEYGETGEYAETEEYTETGEYEGTEEYTETSEHEGNGEYAESGEYEETGEYAESGEYEGAGEYAESGEYEGTEDYAESGEYEGTKDYAESGEYEGTEDYAESGEYEGTGDYAESGEYEGTEEYPEIGEYEETEEYADNEGALRWEEENFAEPAGRGDAERGKKRRHSLDKLDRIDWVMLGTGAAVLILALVAGGIFVNAQVRKNQVSDFADVGAQLEGISIIGEKGLVAVAAAETAKMEAAVLTEDEEEKKEYEETAYDRQISISPIFTSIQRDLKIKFINQKTGKLVPNVPFSVSVTDPSGKSVVWSDDDMDGIIYKKDIAAGDYQVTMETLKDARYSEYMVSAVTSTTAVQEEIVYKQVDVADEVKQESEVNVATEDTKKNETIVESVLTDTVAWVESKVIGVTYNEIAKSAIPDPATIAMTGVLMPTVEESVSGATSESAPKTTSGTDTTTEPASKATTEPDTTPKTVSGFVTTSEPVTTSAPTSGSTAEPTGTPEPVTTSAPSSGSTTEPTGTPEPVTTSAPSSGSTGEPTGTSAPTSPSAPTTEPTETPAPTSPSAPTAEPTGTPAPTPTSGPTAEPTGTPEPTSSSAPTTEPTGTPAPTTTPAPTSGPTATPTGTPAPTPTSGPTAKPTATPAPTPTPAPTATPAPGSGRTIVLDRSSATVFLTVPVVINVSVNDASDAVGTVTAESSNTEVAQVSVSGSVVTVTGVGEGGADVIVKYVENGEEATAVCVVTVKKHPREDTKTKLKDAAGNQLYILEDGAYREAVYADYYQAEKFYLVGGAMYCGWQTIDGRIYYFTADGVKVTGEQIIQGAKYQFEDNGALVTGEGAIGIDVSKWNGTIDWNAVKNSGVSYVIIRCGYRGSSTGKLIEDPQFGANMKGALGAGLKVGVYFYSQAIDEIEAVEEASMVLEQIKNYKITYPVFIDVERSGGRGDKIDTNTRTAVCRAFCQTIQNANYTAGVYSNKLWMEQQINMAELNTYKVWLAQYASSPTYSGKYDIWQYKANGSVSGVKGDVDLNISYLEN